MTMLQMGERQVERKDVQAAFASCSSDNPLYIKVSDIKLVMRALGFEPRNAEVEAMKERLAENEGKRWWHGQKGMCDVDEFTALLGERAHDKTRDEMRCAFKLFDKAGKGWISLADLRQVARELGEKISDEELLEMLTEASGPSDDKVTEEHFFDIMKRTSLY